MVAALCAFLIASPARLTFHEPAMRIQPLLERLCQVSGTKMKATGDLVRQVALVSVDNVELKDLMDRLADALDAKWRQDGDIAVLAADPLKLKLEEARARQLRIKVIKEALEPSAKTFAIKFDDQTARALADRLVQLLAAVQSNGADKNAREQYDAANRQGPTRRLLFRLLSTIPVEDLAQIDIGDRVIYSLNPTKLQRAFGPGASDAMAAFFKEQALFAEALSKVQVSQGDSRSVNDALTWSEAFTADPKSLYLAISLAANGDLSCNLMLHTDDRPQVVAQFWERAASDNAVFQIAGDPNRKSKDLVALSPEATELVAFAKNSWPGRERPKEPVSPLLLQQLSQPLSHEPLGYVPTDVLRSLASAEKKNLIAWVPDSLFTMTLFLASQRPLTMTDARDMIGLSSQGVDTMVDGDWMTITPKNPVRARRDFEDRAAMGAFVRAAMTGHVSLDAYADYAASSDHGPYDGLGLAFAFFIDPTFGSMSDASDWDALRLLGSLEPDKRDALRKGQRLAFQALTSRQKLMVKQITFRRAINGATYTSPNAWRTDGREVEPTDVLTDWVPTDGLLSIQLTRRSTLYAYSRDSEGKLKASRTIEPDTIAWMLYAKDHPKPGENVPAPPEAFAVGGQSIYRMRLNYSEKLWNELRLTDNELPAGQPGPWADLPKEYKSAIEGSLKGYSDRGVGKTGTGVPPPKQ